MTDECRDGAEWLAQRIASKRALIVAYEAAILALSTGAQSYQLHTGQTQQLVTRANLGSMRLVLTGLEQDLATLEARQGCAQFVVRPGW